MKALPRLSLPGGVDGDGHVLEPPDLWERYLEAPLRSRALRVRKNDQGLENLERVFLYPTLGDLVAAERELRRAAKDGVRGVWVPPFTTTRRPLGHPDHHRVFAAAQELGLPLGIHPCFEPKWCAPGRFGEMTSARYAFFINVTAPEYVPEVERIVAQLPESARAGFLGRNVLRAYGIEA